MQCKVKKHADLGDDYQHKLLGLNKKEAFFLQNFLNTTVSSEQPLEMGKYWDCNSCLWVSEDEYQALLDNAELLGIEFIVEGHLRDGNTVEEVP